MGVLILIGAAAAAFLIFRGAAGNVAKGSSDTGPPIIPPSTGPATETRSGRGAF